MPANSDAVVSAKRQKSCSVSLFDSLDEDLVEYIFQFLGSSICVGAAPQPQAPAAAISRQPKETQLSDATPYLLMRQRRGSLQSFSTASTSEEQMDGFESCADISSAHAMQALACTCRRFRRIIFDVSCSKCICTVPTLVFNVVQNMRIVLLHLDLHHCADIIDDCHCEPLHALASLQSLNLSNCSSLTSEALIYLRDMEFLTCLNLSRCRGISPSGYNFLPTSIKHLKLAHMHEHRTPLLTYLPRLTSLLSLDLTDNNAMTSGLAGIHALAALTSLSVADCDLLADVDILFISALRSLRSLDLSGTAVSSSAVASLTSLPSLTHVSLDGCHRITQADVTWMRQHSDSAAWRAVHISQEGGTVDPARLALTPDPEAPPATASVHRRSRRAAPQHHRASVPAVATTIAGSPGQGFAFTV